MYKELINNLKPELEKTITFLKGEFMKIKTSRATPAMIEDIVVNVYSQLLPIKQLGNINVPQPRVITVQPWDNSVITQIEKAIRDNSSFSPVVDGEMIRI
ncbi:ribosome recycling factor, partial [Patescibacteria group bacterium]|nr:ribosome recycling factor [Patescibacteria group bacterium]